MSVQQSVYDNAETFIKTFLKHTKNRSDTILVKNLYTEYCESADKQITKRQFNKVLELHGFLVAKGNGNKLTVFYIKSSWL